MAATARLARGRVAGRAEAEASRDVLESALYDQLARLVRAARAVDCAPGARS